MRVPFLRTLVVALMCATNAGVALADPPAAADLANRIRAARSAAVQRELLGEQQDAQKRQLALLAAQTAALQQQARAEAQAAQGLQIGAANANGAVNVRLPTGPSLGQGLVVGALTINVQNGDGNAASNAVRQ